MHASDCQKEKTKKKNRKQNKRILRSTSNQLVGTVDVGAVEVPVWWTFVCRLFTFPVFLYPLGMMSAYRT